MRPADSPIRWAAAVLLGLLLAPPPASAACPDEPARAVVCEINRERAERGLTTVELVDRLAGAAREHARDMAAELGARWR
jgi:hypothetical protein